MKQTDLAIYYILLLLTCLVWKVRDWVDIILDNQDIIITLLKGSM